MKNGFFAYSSKPESCRHAIEGAIKEINKSLDFRIKSWMELNKHGRIINSEVLFEINNADFFCADLTGINDNVLFELGYAISRDKPIFLMLDTSITESQRRFKELNLITTIGYENYQNSTHIVDHFYDFAAKNLQKGYYDSLIRAFAKPADRKALLHLKSKYSTESSKHILQLIEEYKIPNILDDAAENKVQPMIWYIEQLSNVHSVICEFIPTTRIGHEIQNSKSAFIAGLALGLDLNILMTCEEPYETPIDYHDLLQKYNSPKACRNIIEPFLQSINDNISKILTTKNNLARQAKTRTEFQSIKFGDFIAENEKDELFDYFVETYFSDELIKNDLSIVVGRKGAGKSATLLFLNEVLSKDKRNVVCLIKPVNFEIDGLVILIENISDEFEKSFLIEAVWKFLIITEMAKNLYDKLKEKLFHAISDVDAKFIEYIENNSQLYIEDISTRLEHRIKEIEKKTEVKLTQSEFKSKISESLHLENVHTLKQHFANVIGKDKKVIVLIDNLDKSWRKDNKIQVLSRIILGLVSSADRIVGDISIIKQKHININFNLTIFLRSDIYKNIIQYAREPDKINPIWLTYDDFEVFFRIIEERFSVLNSKNVSDLWEKYIATEVNGEDTKHFIINRILPRPRDVIFFFKRAQVAAIARGHDMIQSTDLEKAYEEYSAWVFDSLIVENGLTISQMEEFMYGLVGENSIISIENLIKIMKKAKINIPTPEYLEYFIDHLVSLSILGREIKVDVFEFEFEFNLKIRNKILNNKLNKRRFKIHPVLYPHLGIE